MKRTSLSKVQSRGSDSTLYESEIRIADKYLLNHVVHIDTSFLNQFDLVHSRLAVGQIPEETCCYYRDEFAKKSASSNIALCSQLKQDAVAVRQELLLQHVRVTALDFLNNVIPCKNLRAADIIRANRDQAMTYWAAHQTWLHANEEESRHMHPEISSPEVSFTMNAAIHGEKDASNEKRRLGVVHINKRPSSATQSDPSGEKTDKDAPKSLFFDDEDDERYTVVKFINPQHTAPQLPVRKKNSRGGALSMKPKRHGTKTAIPRMKAPQAVDMARLGVMLTFCYSCAQQPSSLRVNVDTNEDWFANLWHLISGKKTTYIGSTSGPSVKSKANQEVVDKEVEASAHDGSSVKASDSITNGSNDKASHWNKVLPTVLIPLVVPIPRSLTWCRLTENYWADEDPVLRYVPYFGDDDLTGFDTSYYEYVPGELEGEIGGEVLETAITVLTDLFSTAGGALDAEGAEKEEKIPSDDDIEPLPTALESCLMVAFGLSVTQVRQALVKGRHHVSKDHRELPLATKHRLENVLGCKQFLPLTAPAVIACFPPHVEELYYSDTGLRKSGVYSTVSSNFTDLFCRRCYKYDCKTHAINQPLPNQRKDPHAPIFASTNDTLKRILSMPGEQDASNKRARGCGLRNESGAPVFFAETVNVHIPFGMYANNDNQTTASKPINKMKSGKTAHSVAMPTMLIRKPSVVMSAAECALALKLRDIFNSSLMLPIGADTSPPNFQDFDMIINEQIASLLGTCAPSEVAEMCRLAEKDAIEAGVDRLVSHHHHHHHHHEALLDSFRDGKKTKKKPFALNIGINKQALHNIRSNAAQSMREVHRPCTHKGPCVLGVCDCVTANGYCEVTCACWGSKCEIQFQGCKCKSGQCRTKSCGCFAAERECDPNLCMTCGVSVHPLLRDMQRISEAKLGVGSSSSEIDTRVCCNANMLLGLGKRVSIGRSSIHGWGTFIRESAQKGDFIMEYRGEMISQNEADRRGKRFDKIDSTFLFNLCEEVCIDATRKGSKAKFANHSFTPNCYSRIKLVRGDYRIGIYAYRPLRSGEEITFNYDMRVSDDDAPGWCVTLQTSSSKKNSFLTPQKS